MNITDYINAIKAVDSKANHENYYRGHSNSGYSLSPSIYRNGLIDNEDNIFKETILRTPHEFINHRTTLEKLVKMQHYGVPTRLLDITSNPLVALYFACATNKDKDGEVIFFQIPNDHIKFYGSDTISVLANIAKRPANFDIDIHATTISAFNETDSIQFLLHEIKEEKSYFHDIINPKHLEDIFAVKAKLDNPRIIKQSGAFLLFGINANKKRQAEVSYKWIVNKTKDIKFIIPHADKKDILNDLSLLGFDQSTLFPEIENQGQHLVNKYAVLT